MRHKWDYTQYGKDTRDMLCLGRRVCVNCGETHRKHNKQSWMRVVGYTWDGDGRSPCPGPPKKKANAEMKRNDFQPGDLVEMNGKRYVVGERKFWGGSGDYIWGWPATKFGKADKRKDGFYLNPATTKLIRRSDCQSK